MVTIKESHYIKQKALHDTEALFLAKRHFHKAPKIKLINSVTTLRNL